MCVCGRARRSASTSTSRSARRGAATATSTPTPPANWAERRRRGGWPRCAPSFAMAAGVVGEVTVDTVFVGGGTPSLLGGEGLADVLDAVRDNFALAAGAEVTTEANPESTSPEFFDALPRRRLHPGVTRHAVGGAGGAGRPRPHPFARDGRRRRRRGAGGRFRAPQPRPDLRHAGGDRRRSAALGGRGAVGRGGPRLRLRPGGRGRHRAGPPGQPRRDRPLPTTMCWPSATR